MTRSLSAVTLSLLLLGAGCTMPAMDGDVGENERAVAVSLSNQDDEPYAVRIALASGDLEGVRVTYENGSSRILDVPDVSALPPAVRANVTDVEPIGEGLRSERFVLEPGSGLGTTFDAVRPESRLIYVVSSAGGNRNVRSLGTTRCAATDARLDFSLTVGPDSAIDVSTTCTADGPSAG